MLPLRVNADYEQELFLGTKSKEIINHSLEFLAFYLEEGPFYSTKKYHLDFIEHVESVRNSKLQIVTTGEFRNWWGKLENIELEKKFNSKLTPFEFGKEVGLFQDASIITSENDLRPGHFLKPMLLKNAYGMSGAGIYKLRKDLKIEIHENDKYILEPERERVWDFSCFVQEDNSILFYQNIVDQHFKYKGSVFQNILEPKLDQLIFYQALSENAWRHYLKHLHLLIDHYRKLGALSGFSVDSYIYREDGELRIMPYCEVNYRKTMGYVTYMLSQKYSHHNLWNALLICKNSKLNFKELKTQLNSFPNAILLSPGDVRFMMIFISDKNYISAHNTINEIQKLIPEFSIISKVIV